MGGAGMAYRIGGGDVGMAGGDDLIARLHADGQQRQMQGGGAVRDCAGVLGADEWRTGGLAPR